MKKTIYTLAKGFYYAFTVFFAFVVVFSLLSFAEFQLGWDVPFVALKEEGTYALINIPLVELSIGFQFKIQVLLVMWLGILFYVIYFYTLKEFFKVFVDEKVFSSKSLKRLKTFFYMNLIPLLYAAALSLYTVGSDRQFKFEEDQGIALVHLFIALLGYLYLDLLKKGKILQQENDLTI